VSPRTSGRRLADVTGEDLGWFWTEWFETNTQLDQAVESVEYVDGDPARGALVTVRNLGDMVMPARIRVVERDGRSLDATIPVEAWATGRSFTRRVDTTMPLASVTLDPDEQLPDVQPENDSWKP